jgi:hypothetical protein
MKIFEFFNIIFKNMSSEKQISNQFENNQNLNEHSALLNFNDNQ